MPAIYFVSGPSSKSVQQQQLLGSQLSQQLGRQAVQQHMKPKQTVAAKPGGISVKSIYNENLIGGSQSRGGAGPSPGGAGQSPYQQQGWQSKNQQQQQQQLLKQAGLIRFWFKLFDLYLFIFIYIYLYLFIFIYIYLYLFIFIFIYLYLFIVTYFSCFTFCR